MPVGDNAGITGSRVKQRRVKGDRMTAPPQQWVPLIACVQATRLGSEVYRIGLQPCHLAESVRIISEGSIDVGKAVSAVNSHQGLWNWIEVPEDELEKSIERSEFNRNGCKRACR